MSDQTSPDVEPKALLSSKTVQGILVAALPRALELLGIHIPQDVLSADTLDIIALFGAAWAIYGRHKATGGGLTLSGSKGAASAIVGALFLGSFLSGCASTSQETKDNWAQTGSWLLSKAESIALNTVVSVATSQADASDKADWLDSLATGLRSQAVASFSSDDFAKLVGIWTPDKSHWQSLASQLAALYAQGGSISATQRNELIAQALQIVAAEARTSLASFPQTNREGPTALAGDTSSQVDVERTSVPRARAVGLPALYDGDHVIAGPVIVTHMEEGAR